MTIDAAAGQVSTERYDAVLFDLDGVLTSTATLHNACWTSVFDTFLEHWSATTGVKQAPFDPDADYRRYVDGKPRAAGVRDFLASRGIELPEAPHDAPPGDDSVQAVANAKQTLVARELAAGNVAAFPGSVAWVHALLDAGMRTAVVSSSENCRPILAAAGIADLFETVVDGSDARELGLPGKPAPDMFLEAARRLEIAPARAVVVEDALAGVEAGRAGDFGLVLGVARHGDQEALHAHGADIVVTDLEEMLA
ncbi:MAG TPA: beta-phosphoglucomutase family hydrolase [Solirubrobacteraceae bacterium]|jgi:alpha,alpha-trehalose phosphorylase|nr:beta-phosphoglucomutase family hydrolase [Solirubrobacteraceae bacterium]